MQTGRLQIRTFTVNCLNTAYVRAEVAPYGEDALVLDPDLKHTAEFTGRLLGWSGFTLDEPLYRSDPFQFSVAANSETAVIDLVNDTPFASTFVSAEWEGLYFNRSLGG